MIMPMEQFVTTSLILLMQELSADSWDILLKVSKSLVSVIQFC